MIPFLERALISGGAVTFPGIVIRKKPLVGAGAEVTKSIQLGHLVMGNSASVIKIENSRK